MLTLSRRSGEEIVIGDNVRLKVDEIRGGKVQLSFDAPREVTILRKEILDRDERSDNPAS